MSRGFFMYSSDRSNYIMSFSNVLCTYIYEKNNDMRRQIKIATRKETFQLNTKQAKIRNRNYEVFFIFIN